MVVAALSSSPIATAVLRRHLLPCRNGHEPFPCLYSGDHQGGHIFKVSHPNNTVIEGGYKDYVIPSVFSEKDYKFGLFDGSKCMLGEVLLTH